MTIKGHTIGNKKPLVCVPVMETEASGIIRETRRLVEIHTEMIEWRLDAFSKVTSPNAVREVLKELEPVVKDTVFVYTFRSKKQGGLMSLEAEQICDLHQLAAESGVVDFVDVEYFESGKPEQETKQLQDMGVHVIASHHDFEQTPKPRVIQMILEHLKRCSAEIIKLAVMPQSMQDVLNLLEETNRFHEEFPEQEIITMSMGDMGRISRVAGGFFGSCVTFGAGQQSSAPGQIPQEELKKLLDGLYNCNYSALC